MESALVSFVQQLTGNLYPWIPGVLGSDIGASAQALTKDTLTLFIRADNAEPRRLVNVFDTKGNKVYTLERQGSGTQWYIYSQPDQRQVAAVTVGLLSRTVNRDVPGSTSLHMSSGLLGKLHRHYYDSQGNLYIWSRRSLLLQKISNPGGQSEEHRVNVALARLLRPRRLDWELLIDADQADIVNTLATAFITMKTQWLSSGLYAVAAPGSRASPVKPGSDEKYIDRPVNVPADLLVYQPKKPSAEPRNFFNPPEFLEHKFTGA